MDHAQRAIYELIFERRMAVRSMFLLNPRDPKSGYSKQGRLVLAHLARHCHVLAPVKTSDPLELARVNGMQTVLAMLLDDLHADLPNFAQAMAAEEARQREEIIA